MPLRKRGLKIFQKKRRRKGAFFIFKFLAFVFFFLFCFFVFLFIYYAREFPRPEKFTEKLFIQSTKIYDRSGQILLYDIYGEEKREIVPLEKIPKYLREAVIVAEDHNFYNHFGLDLKGIGRAILVNLKLRKPIQGASTITQQLIRSSFLTREKTLTRKIREIVLTLELERRYSKEQILEWYLNQVPFGQNAYGVEVASQTYFQKSVSQISLAEAATLAALIQAPSYLSENQEELLARKNYILDRLVEFGFLNEEEKNKAKIEEIKFAQVQESIKAPYFTLLVKQQLEEMYGQDFLRERGWRVHTSLDWELQEIAEEVVKEGIKRNKIYNAYNAGLVAIDPKTGEILAMTVGTGDYYAPSLPEGCVSGKNCLFDPQFNVVVGTKENPGRQPGSAFKPFVYATAFKEGYDDKTKVLDELTNFGVWGGKEYFPKNYDGRFRGWVSLREGLAQSLNIPSIKVLYLVGNENKIDNLEIINFLGQEEVFREGLRKSLETAQKMGITTLNKPVSFYGPSIVLGGGEVNLLEMVSAYGVFANEGLKNPPSFILKIEDSQGRIIEENKKNPIRILEIEVARLINNILSDNQARAPIFGPHSPMYFEDYQVSAKTGTTDNFRDGWIIGYTSSIVVGVWAGNNDNSPMEKEPGVVVAGPIWRAFLEKVLPRYPKDYNPAPTLPKGP